MKKKQNRIKMFKFIKQIFFSALVYFGSLSSVNPLACISIKNQECIHMQKFVFSISLKI